MQLTGKHAVQDWWKQVVVLGNRGNEARKQGRVTASDPAKGSRKEQDAWCGLGCTPGKGRHAAAHADEENERASRHFVAQMAEEDLSRDSREIHHGDCQRPGA